MKFLRSLSLCIVALCWSAVFGQRDDRMMLMVDTSMIKLVGEACPMGGPSHYQLIAIHVFGADRDPEDLHRLIRRALRAEADADRIDWGLLQMRASKRWAKVKAWLGPYSTYHISADSLSKAMTFLSSPHSQHHAYRLRGELHSYSTLVLSQDELCNLDCGYRRSF